MSVWGIGIGDFKYFYFVSPQFYSGGELGTMMGGDLTVGVLEIGGNETCMGLGFETI